jgi:hypothetical protein
MSYSLPGTWSRFYKHQMCGNNSLILSGKIQIIPEHSMWQDDYWAAGVSESRLNSARSYIFDQEMHHFSVSFHIELDDFIAENHIGLISKNK